MGEHILVQQSSMLSQSFTSAPQQLTAVFHVAFAMAYLCSELRSILRESWSRQTSTSVVFSPKRQSNVIT